MKLWLAGAFALALTWGVGPALAQGPSRLRVDTTASHEGFGLLPSSGIAESIRGRVSMRQAWSPFGVTVDRDGHGLYELAIDVDSLPPTGPGEQYVAWLATPALDTIAVIGRVTPGIPLTGVSSLNRVLVVISRESGAPADRWRGPIVLRGRSRSALLQSIMTHSIFRRAEY